MKLRIYPDPILREVSEPVTEFGDGLDSLCLDMLDVMLKNNGMGLSAVQVGVLKRIVIMQNPNRPQIIREFINPEIIETDGSFIFSEGCLSVPGYFEERERANKIRLKWQVNAPYQFDADTRIEPGDFQEAEFEGIEAFCIQHELDHLEGKLFVDDLSPLKKDRVRAKIKKTLRSMG